MLVIASNLCMVKAFVHTGKFLEVTTASLVIFASNITFGVG